METLQHENPYDSELQQERPDIFKVIVVGEGGVGKTTFINRYATNVFTEDTKITIGASFSTIQNKVNGGATTTQLQVWDFGGEKRFRFIMPNYCKGAHGVIFAFDLTRSATLLKLNEWVDLVKTNTKNPVSLLIGTKADRVEEVGDKAINDAKIEEFMKQHNVAPDLFFKTSSVTGENIENVFTKMSNLLYQVRK